MLVTERTYWFCRMAACTWVAGAVMIGGGLQAASPNAASTNNATKEEAIQTIPFDKLNEATRAKLGDVVTKPSLYRRMPVQVNDCDPDMYLLLVRYPEVVVNIWQLMGISNVSIKRTGPFTFDASDGAGTVSNVELVYGDGDTHVMYAEGFYEGPLFAKRITAKCVLLLKSAYARGADGHLYVTSRLDLFVQLDNLGAELLAKTLHPLVGRTADSNFAESAGFLARVSQAAERNGPGVQQMAARLTSVDPAIRARFAQVAAVVNERAVLRDTPPADPGVIPTSDLQNTDTAQRR
jgi:hypothetical protein